MTEPAELSELGKITIVLDGQAAIEFEDVPEAEAVALKEKYRARGAGPFWIVHGGKRLLQFPDNPPKGLLWELNE